MIRKATIVMCLVAAAAVSALWGLGCTSHELGPSFYSKTDAAWGHWVMLSCNGVQGQHLRIGLWGGRRIFLRTARSEFSVGYVEPYAWRTGAPDKRRRFSILKFEQHSYRPPTNPRYWVGIEHVDKSTYDDLITVVTFPCWMPLVLFVAYPAVTLVRGPLRRWCRRRRGLCVHCGYDLTGLTEPRCPECAKPIEAPTRPRSDERNES